MLEKRKLPSPPRGSSVKEKIDFYDKLIADGLDAEQLKVVRNRLYKIDTYFQDAEVIIKKDTILQCIKDILEEERQ